jgi:hypothetical protein
MAQERQRRRGFNGGGLDALNRADLHELVEQSLAGSVSLGGGHHLRLGVVAVEQGQELHRLEEIASREDDLELLVVEDEE